MVMQMLDLVDAESTCKVVQAYEPTFSPAVEFPDSGHAQAGRGAPSGPTACDVGNDAYMCRSVGTVPDKVAGDGLSRFRACSFFFAWSASS